MGKREEIERFELSPKIKIPHEQNSKCCNSTRSLKLKSGIWVWVEKYLEEFTN